MKKGEMEGFTMVGYKFRSGKLPFVKGLGVCLWEGGRKKKTMTLRSPFWKKKRPNMKNGTRSPEKEAPPSH